MKRTRTAAQKRNNRRQTRAHHAMNLTAPEMSALRNLTAHRAARYPTDEAGLKAHAVRQTLADYAVATALGLELPERPGTFKLPDGTLLRVRAAGRHRAPYLIAASHVANPRLTHHVLVWVTGEQTARPEVVIAGWCDTAKLRLLAGDFLGHNREKPSLSLGSHHLAPIGALRQKLAQMTGVVSLLRLVSTFAPPPAPPRTDTLVFE